MSKKSPPGGDKRDAEEGATPGGEGAGQGEEVRLLQLPPAGPRVVGVPGGRLRRSKEPARHRTGEDLLQGKVFSNYRKKSYPNRRNIRKLST